MRTLKSADPTVRAFAAMKAGTSRTPGTTRALLQALADPVAEVRLRAAESLGILLRGRKAPPALVDRLRDTDPLVRAEVADSLGAIGDRSVVPMLWRAVADTDPLVRAYGITAIGELGQKGDATRLERRRSVERHALVRIAIEEATAQMGMRRAVDRIARQLGNPNYQVRCAGANTLAELACSRQAGKEALGALRQALRHERTRAARSSMQNAIRSIDRLLASCE